MLASAIRYAKEAGDQILRGMSEPYRIRDKANHADLVTEVDLRSEQLLRQAIARDYPDHWILSEETDGAGDPFRFMEQPLPGCGWIVDPIDGTINFVHGIEHFAVSIGIMKDGCLLHGVVYNPSTGELYHASAGKGAYRNGQPIRVSEERSLPDATLATGFQASDWREGSRAIAQMNRIAGTARTVRIFGAASLDLCLVACGRLSGFWHDGLYPWDVAAGLIILLEAGGAATTASAGPYRLSERSLVASNPALQSGLLDALRLKGDEARAGSV